MPTSRGRARLICAATPLSSLPKPAARTCRVAGGAVNLARATDCLAAAAWYEAGDDPSGERAFVQVVLNRLRHPAFPNTVCALVFQGSERVAGCQFTCSCDGRSDEHSTALYSIMCISYAVFC